MGLCGWIVASEMNIMVVHWVFITGWSRVLAYLGESQESFDEQVESE